ncbi:MAG TPA: hypothetical protein VGX94_07145 [Terriglobia bacterium]|nr:hypothetical protein [Terriglobia bacterium]
MNLQQRAPITQTPPQRMQNRKKGPLFKAGLGERSNLQKLETYLFFLAAFFFAGISVVTSSPDFHECFSSATPWGFLRCCPYM